MESVGQSLGGGGGKTGWQHVEQSIRVILTTPVGSRVMRRRFGSRLMALIDAPMTDLVILECYAAIAEALAAWEPRFRLDTAAVENPNAAGEIAFVLAGTYFPRGHLGDFSIAEGQTASINVRRSL